jgi:pyruvate/2-oxoglutarate dehydrogenase complex dihydrolipoamide dehydrogenase (E3) component
MAIDRPWDLLVIGGGTAGIVGAKTAAHLGARVALVETARTGGDCLWTGCVPSKTLLASAASVRPPTSADGRPDGAVDVDFPAVMGHIQDVIRRIEPVDSPEALEQEGVTVLTGWARFTGTTEASVDGRRVPFVRALLATGGTPALPSVPGLADARPLTSETVWGLGERPEHLLVLGGGSIGCELAQAFARLGSGVTLVESGARLLPREDPDAAALVQSALEADGVVVLTEHQAVKVVGDGRGGGDVHLSADGDRVVVCDALLVAVGRQPRTSDLGLEAAGIDVDDRGFVTVDPRLRTTNARVWAAGDVTPLPQFTHLAGVNGSLAASNAVLGLRRRADRAPVPRVTFTDPEVAAVGAPSWGDDRAAARTVTRRHEDVDRAVTDGRTDGFTRLVLDGRRRIIGATVVGPRAGESLGELTLAVRRRLSTGDVSGTIHAYPTYSDGVWNAAIADTRDRLGSPAVRRATSALTALRRIGGNRSAHRRR